MRFVLRLAPALLLAFVACGDSPSGPDTGSLKITVNATGTDADERFAVKVNDGAEQAYTGTAITSTGLEPGTYTVSLSGVASNCTLQGAPQLQVSVTAGWTAEAAFTVSCAARFIVFTQNAFGTELDIYKVDRTGANLSRLTLTANNAHPAFSPDGKKIVFSSTRDRNAEIYVMNADGSAPARLTNRVADDVTPSWSPDGARIVFAAVSGTVGSVWVMNADGSGMMQIPLGNLTSIAGPRWSPDGTRIVLFAQAPGSDYNIYVVTLATGAVAKVTTHAGNDLDPSWTPDGRIVYASVDIGFAVHIMNADGTNGSLLYDDPARLEFSPRMSPDGKMLLYAGQAASGGSRLFVVPVAGGAPVQVASGNASRADWRP